MSKNTFLQSYTKDQPGWAKGITSILIVGGVGLLAYTIYKNYKKAQEIKEATQGAQQAGAELEGLASAGILPTFGDSVYYNWADQLTQAMNGCGTDEDMVYRVFEQLYNDADVLKLISVFGIRYYEPCAWVSPIAFSIWEFNDQAYGGELSTWLGYDLDSSEISHINDILSSKGIKYRF